MVYWESIIGGVEKEKDGKRDVQPLEDEDLVLMQKTQVNTHMATQNHL